ncbi:hypothetical protein ACGFSG_06605 [Streptomyces sp. NPDC048512]|uniref:hypothetical protein n=1 Tax=Streptomyces sp. NPDC048512 TaxID=3365563 RepID=UPI003716F713
MLTKSRQHLMLNMADLGPRRRSFPLDPSGSNAMRSVRRLAVLAAILAAVGGGPPALAQGRADVRHAAPASADRGYGDAGPMRTADGAADGTGLGRHAAGDGPGRGGRAGEESPRGRRNARSERTDPFVVVASAAAGAGALVALFLSVSRALRRRRG